jgi:drug/metabolite transporter (DMT)-like permease
MAIEQDTNRSKKRWLEIFSSVPMGLLGLLGIWLSIWITCVYLTTPKVDSKIFLFVAAVFPIGIFCLLTAWRLFRGISARKDMKLISPIILFILGLFFLFNAAVFFYSINSISASVASVVVSMLCFIQAFRKTKINKALSEESTQQAGLS